MLSIPHRQTQDCSATDQAFILKLHNLHLQICKQEEENAWLKARSSQLDKQVFTEERAVQRAEEWICDNEENLSHQESILIREEKELDYWTDQLTKVIDEMDELCPKGHEAFEETQNLQNTLLDLHWKLEHPEEVGEEEAQTLVQALEEELSNGLDLEQIIVEEQQAETHTDTVKKSKKRKKSKKKSKWCGCFSFLWNFVWN